MTASFLFIPVSGPSGSGELQRAFVLARAVQGRWPDARIEFAVSRHARGASSTGFSTLLLDDSPTHSTPAIVDLIERVRPTVTIFDGAARVAQLRAARETGSRTVFVSSRPSGRRKAFKWRRLRRLDQLWFTQPEFLEPPLERMERFKLARSSTALETIGPIFAQLEVPAAHNLLALHRLAPGDFVVFCLGLASREPRLAAAQAVFQRVAQDFAHETGTRTVLIGGASTPDANVLSLAPLPNAELVALLAHARFVCVNGGSLLLQALAVGASAIAVPVNNDQPARIAACERHGLAIAASAEADSLLATVMSLDHDAARRESLYRAIAAQEIVNGVPLAIDALEKLLGEHKGSHVSDR